MEAIRDAQVAAQEAEERVVADPALLVRHPEHLQAGEEQEGAEEIEDPAELADKRRAHRNHRAAHHDHAEDAPEKHAVLVLPGHREVPEDHRDGEDVVEGQRPLDHEARVVLEARLRAHRPPHPAAEGDGQREVEGREHDALADPDLLLVLVQDAEVEREDRGHDRQEDGPHPDRLAEEVVEQEGER